MRLNELKMSPSHLAKFGETGGQDIIGGFEAECILADVRDAADKQPDYSNDGRFEYNIDLYDVASFFEVDPRHSREFRNLEREYEDWKKATISNWIEEHLKDKAEELMFAYNSGKAYEDQLPIEDFKNDAIDLLDEIAEYKNDLSLHQFFWQAGKITDWREIGEHFDLAWPHMAADEEAGLKWDGYVAQDAAEELSNHIGKKVVVNHEHGGDRFEGTYHIEPDSSLVPDDSTDMGVEIISPPMPLNDMMADLENTFHYIDYHAYTNDSTGLHINLSIPDKKVDYTKLVLFLGDAHVLKQFGREANSYAQSSIQDLSGLVARGETTRAFELLQKGLLDMAGKTMRERNLSKYFSVNMHHNYVEFRSMGGDYVTMWGEIKNNVLRFAQALAVACDPQAERKEYALKLYKLLTQEQIGEGFRDAIHVFSLYGSGVLSKETMRKYLRKRASQRVKQ
jgi:hypothetical protein